jgi:hypothetical protein
MRVIYTIRFPKYISTYSYSARYTSVFWKEHWLTDTELLRLRDKNENGKRKEGTEPPEPKHQSCIMRIKRETGTPVAGSTVHILHFLFQINNVAVMFHFHFSPLILLFPFPPSGGGRKNDKRQYIVQSTMCAPCHEPVVCTPVFCTRYIRICVATMQI